MKNLEKEAAAEPQQNSVRQKNTSFNSFLWADYEYPIHFCRDADFEHEKGHVCHTATYSYKSSVLSNIAKAFPSVLLLLN